MSTANNNTQITTGKEARIERGDNLMIERIKTHFEALEGLSTEELDHSVEKLVRAEKRNVALVIAHIAEMSRRKGHLERESVRLLRKTSSPE